MASFTIQQKAFRVLIHLHKNKIIKGSFKHSNINQALIGMSCFETKDTQSPGTGNPWFLPVSAQRLPHWRGFSWLSKSPCHLCLLFSQNTCPHGTSVCLMSFPFHLIVSIINPRLSFLHYCITQRMNSVVVSSMCVIFKWVNNRDCCPGHQSSD